MTATGLEMMGDPALAPVPRFLYKYRQIRDPNWSLKCILKRGTIFFGGPRKFNDSEDCVIPEIAVRSVEKIREWADAKLRRLAPAMTDEERSSNIESFMARRGWEAMRSDVQRDIDATGVLCLSERWDNAELWERYGQNGAGVCVEFLASGTKIFGETQAFKVQYADAEGLGDFEIFGDDYWAQVKRTVLTKGTRWSGEQEWRFLRPGSYERPTIGLVRLPHGVLASVILGPNIADRDRKVVFQWLSERNPRPKVYQATVNALGRYSRTLAG